VTSVDRLYSCYFSMEKPVLLLMCVVSLFLVGFELDLRPLFHSFELGLFLWGFG
jgi:hypothetical protein